MGNTLLNRDLKTRKNCNQEDFANSDLTSRNEFDRYIKDTFSETSETANYQERIGVPDELPAVIGLISMNFSSLEDILSDTIIKMLQIQDNLGQAITSEMSFKAKINLFSSLYEELKDDYYFNAFPGFEKEYFKELVKALNKVEEKRNLVIHSKFVKDYRNNQKIFRLKTTAKQKNGLKKTVEETDIIKLFNIADDIINLEFELDQFQIDIMKKKINKNRE